MNRNYTKYTRFLYFLVLFIADLVTHEAPPVPARKPRPQISPHSKPLPPVPPKDYNFSQHSTDSSSDVTSVCSGLSLQGQRDTSPYYRSPPLSETSFDSRSTLSAVTMDTPSNSRSLRSGSVDSLSCGSRNTSRLSGSLSFDQNFSTEDVCKMPTEMLHSTQAINGSLSAILDGTSFSRLHREICFDIKIRSPICL